ncbi:molecular chaperone DnaJ [Roseobacter denitrificans]|uniref:DnaJ domain protein, putative n=1 Tax=Roseobacter denitrificans (strain ATCC 33942 / OCh 114) TaxID=375451 RepID=Q16B26_ROSDO|nr:J domain-containing protein [Roseobacter denitrificans]ABG30817.1 DnaJ domain protein, putative [Roseobacter denitrificans OCh 114]AVL53922.1 molecular chaperone DnaJ [Roseobacter denitrificans]SFG49887.1 DnaJ domain-containing protein [Roseobacter denitrificans OCh 114]
MAATPEHAARVLGLDVWASMEDVRRARRELAMKYHPDRHSDVTTSNRHMARVNAAADTLIAYISGKSKPGVKTRRPNYTDFSNTCKTETENSKQTSKTHGATAQNPHAQTDTRAVARGTGGTAVNECMAPALVSEHSARDNELIRAAARSYQTVLQQISQPDRLRSVDARALRFTTAA